MSITITEKNTIKGELQLQKSSLTRQYTRYFIAQSSVTTSTPVDIFTATGLPKIGDLYSPDSSVWCTQVTPTKREDAPHFWDIEVVYSVPENKSDNPSPPGSDPTDPVDWMVDVSGSFVKRQIPCEVDTTGHAIVNSAKEQFLPPPTKDREDLRLTISRYEEAGDPCVNADTGLIDMSVVQQYNGSINSGAIFDISAGQGKLSITFNKERINSGIYWKIVYTIECNPDGWNLKLVDKGFLHVVDGTSGAEMVSPSWPGGAKQVVMTDDNGVPCKSPQLLNGCGGKLSPGATPVAFPADGYVVYPLKDWSPLDLGLE